MPVQTEDDKAFPSKHNEHKPAHCKPNKSRKPKGKSTAKKVNTDAYTDKQLKQMADSGEGRFARNHSDKKIANPAGQTDKPNVAKSSSRRKRSTVA